MLLPGGRVVAGISGGADSICLLFVLLEWKKRWGLEIAVAHVDHGIRAEAAADARFVEGLCGRLGLPFFLWRADIPGLAAERRCSDEEAGRDFRYESFQRIAQEFEADRIAVAHHLNDRCETMLFHLFRGSGIKGLEGIPPVRAMGPYWVIRPLLRTQRSEIEEYLAQKGQSYCQDKTNEEDDYTRNRIRHHILPYVEEHIAQGCVQRMGQTAELLEETEDYLRLQTLAAREECVRWVCAKDSVPVECIKGSASNKNSILSDGYDRHTLGKGEKRQSGEYILECAKLAGLHRAIRRRLLHELLVELSPHAKDIGQAHVSGLEELLLRQGNRKVDLPFGICGRREYEKVYLWRKQAEETGRAVGQGTCAELGSSMPVIPEAIFLVLSIDDLPRDEENFLIFPSNKYTKWFDYDKMKESPVLRTRAIGDYLTIRDGSGETRHKKLKDYMLNEKIPPRQRDQIPVLAENSHVLWLVGYRISEYYKITANTKRVLQVQLNLLG